MSIEIFQCSVRRRRRRRRPRRNSLAKGKKNVKKSGEKKFSAEKLHRRSQESPGAESPGELITRKWTTAVNSRYNDCYALFPAALAVSRALGRFLLLCFY